MALSAHDKRIISALEREIVDDDPEWASRFHRWNEGFQHLEQVASHRGSAVVRHRLAIGALLSAWVALVCADAANGPGPLLWAALAASSAALGLTWARLRVHRRRGSGYGRVARS
jgi:hypothetical protein